MSVTVTLHIFSGRPDRAWELTDDQARELADRIAPVSDPCTCDRGPYTDFCGFYHCIPANTRIQ